MSHEVQKTNQFDPTGFVRNLDACLDAETEELASIDALKLVAKDCILATSVKFAFERVIHERHNDIASSSSTERNDIEDDLSALHTLYRIVGDVHDTNTYLYATPFDTLTKDVASKSAEDEIVQIVELIKTILATRRLKRNHVKDLSNNLQTSDDIEKAFKLLNAYREEHTLRLTNEILNEHQSRLYESRLFIELSMKLAHMYRERIIDELGPEIHYRIAERIANEKWSAFINSLAEDEATTK